MRPRVPKLAFLPDLSETDVLAYGLSQTQQIKDAIEIPGLSKAALDVLRDVQTARGMAEVQREGEGYDERQRRREEAVAAAWQKGRADPRIAGELERFFAAASQRLGEEGERAASRSTNPIERLNGEIKRHSDAVGIFPNEAAVTRHTMFPNSRRQTVLVAVSPSLPPPPVGFGTPGMRNTTSTLSSSISIRRTRARIMSRRLCQSS